MPKVMKLAACAASAAACGALAPPASAQLLLAPTPFPRGEIQGSDPLVGLPLPGATPNEYRAHLLWNLRAGLNVAALQCQFSPFLRTVGNYNDILAHHSAELANAYSALNAYFKRVHGAKEGMRRFDDYSTITYNNFSTLQAQYGFCQTAADIAKEALTRPKGGFHLTAETRMREFRGSLVPFYDPLRPYHYAVLTRPVLPPLDPACYDKKDRLRKKCATPLYAARS